jgi:hypothetical protein
LGTRGLRRQFSRSTAFDRLGRPGGALPRIAGIGPASAKIIREILDTGGSPTVERLVDESGRRSDIDRRRQLRQHFLSRAEVRRVLSDPSCAGPPFRSTVATCRCTPNGATVTDGLEIADACRERGYHYAAVTDHSHGLKIAGGMSMAEAAEQRKAIDEVNRRQAKRFRLLQGIEANIDATGQLDLPTMRRPLRRGAGGTTFPPAQG